MNLHSIVSGAISAVNPPIEAMISQSIGATGNSDFSRTPIYAAPVPAPIQAQDLSTADLQQIDGLNLQAIYKKVYLNGAVAGMVRTAGTGGDMMTFSGFTWKVVKVAETWPDWTCAIVIQQ